MRPDRTLFAAIGLLIAQSSTAGTHLSAFPPRPGLRLVPDVAFEWDGSELSGLRFANGREAARTVLGRLRGSPSASWEALYDPDGRIEWRIVDSRRARVLLRATMETSGTYLGRMPGGIEVESPTGSARFDEAVIPLSSGTSGRLYLEGAARAFALAGQYTLGKGPVRVTYFALESDRTTPLSLLPVAGMALLSGPEAGGGEDPVPEPSTLFAGLGVAILASRRVSGLRGRRAGPPRRAAAARTGTR